MSRLMCYDGSMANRQATLSLHLLFRALADPTRLRMLSLIADGEICVCYFVEILQMSQPKISRHLAYLRKAGIAADRREGKWMHCRRVVANDIIAASILQETLKHFRKKPEMKRDVLKLGVACCSPQKFELLQGAPQPAVLLQNT